MRITIKFSRNAQNDGVGKLSCPMRLSRRTAFFTIVLDTQLNSLAGGQAALISAD